MKNTLLLISFCVIFGLIIACQSQNKSVGNTNFQQFDHYFSTITWQDTFNTKNTDFALGYSYEIKVPLIADSVFYQAIDTVLLENNHWDNRIYAEGKIQLPNQYIGYFTTRQTDDISYDRTTNLLIFDKNNRFVQDFIFSEFIGYEGYITSTHSKLFKNDNGILMIQSQKEESYFDYEKEEHIEKSETMVKQWKNGKFVAL